MSWEEVKVGDLGKVITGNTPPKKNPEFYGESFKFIKPTDMIIDNKYTPVTEECYSQLAYEKYVNSLIPPFSTCVVTIGSIGKKMTMTNEYSFVNQAVNAVIPFEDKFDNHFVYYALKNILDKVKNADTGASSGRENVSKSNFMSLSLTVPKSLETQKRIASILSNYDDLIENNHKRIKLLEESAQNIYKEWFVNFRFPNYEHTKFNAESGLPVGWEKKKVEDVAKLIHGYAFDAKRFTEDPTEVMVLRMGNFKEKGGLQLDKNVKYISKEYDFNEKFKLFAGDLIIVLSDVTRDGRIIGNVGILPDYGIEYALNQRVAKLECENKIKTYLYCALNSFDFKEHCKPRANGATVLNLKSIDVNEYKIIVPPESIIESFSAVINPLLKIMENLDLQNQKLKEARDILLPRLMNRTIEV